MVTFGSCSDGKHGAGALEFPFCGRGADRAATETPLLSWQRPHKPNLCAL